MTIAQFINQYGGKERDKKVLEEIANYTNINIEGINDGLYTNFLVMGKSVNKRFLDLYNLDMHEWKEFKKKNKVLSKDYKIAEDLVKLCFLTSYTNTKNPIFLEFVLLMFAGSKMSHYFPYRDSKAYEARMRYTIEYIVPGQSLIKKAGTLYGALQMSTQQMLSSDITKKRIASMGTNDNEMIYMLGMMRTRANDMIKRLKNNFVEAQNREKTMNFSKDIDLGEGEILEIANDSTFINTLKYKIDEYNSANYDLDVLKLLGVKEKVSKYILVETLKNETDLFKQFAHLFLTYFTDIYGTSKTQLMNDYLHKMATARMNSEKLSKLENVLYKHFLSNLKDYKEANPTEDVPKPVEVAKLVKVYKNYIIIKTRKLASSI